MSLELIGDETAPSFFMLEDFDVKVRENVDLAADFETTFIVSLCCIQPPKYLNLTIKRLLLNQDSVACVF